MVLCMCNLLCCFIHMTCGYILMWINNKWHIWWCSRLVCPLLLMFYSCPPNTTCGIHFWHYCQAQHPGELTSACWGGTPSLFYGSNALNPLHSKTRQKAFHAPSRANGKKSQPLCVCKGHRRLLYFTLSPCDTVCSNVLESLWDDFSNNHFLFSSFCPVIAILL